MALSIKTEEADRLARELAQVRGESITAVVTSSLREALERAKVEQRRDKEASLDALLAEAKEFFKGTTAPTKEDFDALWEE
jgi:antitoxin VapB